ncbi:RIKEN cDNA 2010305C02, isoform CRA_b, partial [Mus musculus]
FFSGKLYVLTQLKLPVEELLPSAPGFVEEEEKQQLCLSSGSVSLQHWVHGSAVLIQHGASEVRKGSLEATEAGTRQWRTWPGTTRAYPDIGQRGT